MKMANGGEGGEQLPVEGTVGELWLVKLLGEES